MVSVASVSLVAIAAAKVLGGDCGAGGDSNHGDPCSAGFGIDLVATNFSSFVILTMTGGNALSCLCSFVDVLIRCLSIVEIMACSPAHDYSPRHVRSEGHPNAPAEATMRIRVCHQKSIETTDPKYESSLLVELLLESGQLFVIPGGHWRWMRGDLMSQWRTAPRLLESYSKAY